MKARTPNLTLQQENILEKGELGVQFLQTMKVSELEYYTFLSAIAYYLLSVGFQELNLRSYGDRSGFIKLGSLLPRLPFSWTVAGPMEYLNWFSEVCKWIPLLFILYCPRRLRNQLFA